MQGNKNCNRQMEINDLIDDAIANAVTRRSLIETEDALFAVSDKEAAMIAGGTGVQEAAAVSKKDITIAGFKPVNPPIKPPVKPVCPPIVVGLIALPTDKKLA